MKKCFINWTWIFFFFLLLPIAQINLITLTNIPWKASKGMPQCSSCELSSFIRKAWEKLERIRVFCNSVFKKKVPVRLTHMTKTISHLGSLKKHRNEEYFVNFRYTVSGSVNWHNLYQGQCGKTYNAYTFFQPFPFHIVGYTSIFNASSFVKLKDGP